MYMTLLFVTLDIIHMHTLEWPFLWNFIFNIMETRICGENVHVSQNGVVQ